MNPNGLTIKEARDALDSGKLTSVELTDACLSSIQKHDEKVKSFITVTAKEAREGAKIFDNGKAKGGPLAGIPFSAKDVILTEDVKTTASSNFLKNFTAPYDATVIKRLKDSGAILIGKTNCDAYGHGTSTDNSDFFVSRTPWDTERVAGGSSGGCAAAVSSDMTMFSLGEDTGGSIRVPASFCGVTGLKVSYGRVPRYGSIAYASSFDTIGPIAKTAEDAAMVLQAIAGIDTNDHTTRPDKVPDYVEGLKKPIKGVRVGVPREFFEDNYDERVRKTVLETLEIFKSLGCEIKKVSLPNATDAALATYYMLVTAETSTNLARLDGVRFGYQEKGVKSLTELYEKSRSYGFGEENKRRIMLGTYALSSGYYDAYYKKAQQVRTIIRKGFDDVFKNVDVCISPTSPVLPFAPGEKSADPMELYLIDIFTTGFSLAGIPTISIPCGFVDGLPVGVQITGDYMREELVLSVAHKYQKETNFHKQKPSL